MAIYKAKLDTPYGYFTVAVDCKEPSDVREDIYNVAYSEFAAPAGMLRIKGNIRRSNRRILARMSPIVKARIGDTYWAWIVKEN